MDPDTTRFDRTLNELKNRKAVVLVLVIGSIVIAIGSFTNSLSDIGKFFSRKNALYRAHVQDGDGDPDPIRWTG